MDLPLMMANFVAPSSVIVLTRNAPGGTSPWSVPPDATLPVGFQLIGQNGLRVPASMWNEDLFLTAMGAGSSVGLAFSSVVADWSSDFFVGAAGADFCSAANASDAVRMETEISEKNLFIGFQ